MSCGVGYRRGLDPTLLWLRRRSGTTALIQPLAWEPPCALGVALEKTKKKKKKKFIENRHTHLVHIAYGCFCATAAELSRCNRDGLAL